ncbi:MAG: hypothetical protein L6Q66_08005 [Bacteroidia bacterium]|nr:hypothetical protein [Bacteroidia bacterium]
MYRSQNNPYKKSCIIFAVISFVSAGYLILGCYFKYTLLDWSDYAIITFNNIIAGILTSALLLLAVEFMLYKKDVNNNGKLAGKYKKIRITGVNEEGKRSNSISIEEKESKEKGSNIKFIEDSIYHDLEYYGLADNTYLTELIYNFNGKYIGSSQYINHGTDHKNFVIKPKCYVNLNLVLTSNFSGEGHYKYIGSDDIGIYKFQIDPENNDRILVYYKNTIPSGAAEGYEIWVREI